MKKKFIKVAAIAATLVLGAALAVGCSGNASSSSPFVVTIIGRQPILFGSR